MLVHQRAASAQTYRFERSCMTTFPCRPNEAGSFCATCDLYGSTDDDPDGTCNSGAYTDTCMVSDDDAAPVLDDGDGSGGYAYGGDDTYAGDDADNDAGDDTVGDDGDDNVYDDGSCPSTCYGTTCDGWADSGATCTSMEVRYCWCCAIAHGHHDSITCTTIQCSHISVVVATRPARRIAATAQDASASHTERSECPLIFRALHAQITAPPTKQL